MRVESTLIFAAAALSIGPAAAAHCPSGEFYRVKLDECVRLSSALARPFLGEATRKAALPLQPVRLAKRMDPGFVDPPQEAPPRPRSSQGRRERQLGLVSHAAGLRGPLGIPRSPGPDDDTP